MSARRGGWLLCASAALALAACAPPRFERTPADRVMSIGIVDGNLGVAAAGGQPANGGAPQSASKVTLRFSGGVPGPFTVVPARVAAPASAGEGLPASTWADVAGSRVPLVPPGEAIGMARDAFEAAWLAGTGRLHAWDNGIRTVFVKAAYDERNLYLLLQWADGTESRSWRDWIAAGGAFVRTAHDEDRVYLAFDVAGSTPRYEASGCAAACHVADGPATADAARFTMRTDAPGQRLAAWVWRASRTAPLAIAEVGHVDAEALRFACDDPPACAAACASGAAPPCSAAPYADNQDGDLPRSMAAAGVDADPALLFADGAEPGPFAALALPAAVPFSAASAPRDGSTLPGAELRVPSAARMAVRADARWTDGVWTLSLTRALVTSDPDDAQFPLR